MPNLEGSEQKKTIKYLETTFDALVLKHIRCSDGGVPDLQVFLGAPYPSFFIEMKTKKGKLLQSQIDMGEEIRGKGVLVYVLYGFDPDRIDSIVKEVKGRQK